MKMNKTLVALCLSAGLLASAPAVTLANVNFVPQNTTSAPAIPAAALQQLVWTPVDQSKTQTTQLSRAVNSLMFRVLPARWRVQRTR
jgi:maltose operon protein